MRVHVRRPRAHELFSERSAEASATVAARVLAARRCAARRGIRCNVFIPANRADELAPLNSEAKQLLIRAVEDGRLSARGVHRVRCVARTVADLAEDEGHLRGPHVATALALRDELLGFSAFRKSS